MKDWQIEYRSWIEKLPVADVIDEMVAAYHYANTYGYVDSIYEKWRYLECKRLIMKKCGKKDENEQPSGKS